MHSLIWVSHPGLGHMLLPHQSRILFSTWRIREPPVNMQSVDVLSSSSPIFSPSQHQPTPLRLPNPPLLSKRSCCCCFLPCNAVLDLGARDGGGGGSPARSPLPSFPPRGPCCATPLFCTKEGHSACSPLPAAAISSAQLAHRPTFSLPPPGWRRGGRCCCRCLPPSSFRALGVGKRARRVPPPGCCSRREGSSAGSCACCSAPASCRAAAGRSPQGPGAPSSPRRAAPGEPHTPPPSCPPKLRSRSRSRTARPGTAGEGAAWVRAGRGGAGRLRPAGETQRELSGGKPSLAQSATHPPPPAASS